MFSNFRYAKAKGSIVLESLDGSILDTESDTDLKNAKETLQKNRKKLFDGHFIDGKKRLVLSHYPLYVTVDQRVVAENVLTNAVKNEIVKRIADKLQKVFDQDVRRPPVEKIETWFDDKHTT